MSEKKTAIVTGAFGFAGANLVENLCEHGYRVFAVGRKGSDHNERLQDLDIEVVHLDMEDYNRLPRMFPHNLEGDVYFFHLAWGGDRNDPDVQRKNVAGADAALRAAAGMDEDLRDRDAGRLRFVGVGSQAEIDPITEYGKCKAETYSLLRAAAQAYDLDFMWARLFSLIGKYEPEGRMLPDLVDSLKAGRPFPLSSCEQNWDYLDAADAAEAMRLIAEKGKNGEIYDVARGEPRPLREYVEEVADILGADRELLHFGERANPFIYLNPSITKIVKDTGWSASVSFRDSVLKY